MTWVILALIAYFLLAIVELTDKKILSSPDINPLPYAFYASLLVSFSFILWPLDFSFLPLLITVFAFFGGAFFFLAIYFLYSAITKGEVSRVVSLVGGISPILIFIFSLLFLGEKLGAYSIFAILMLISGSILLSFVKDGQEFKFGRNLFALSFLASLFFALSYGLTKAVFLNSSFLNGFIWTRTGTVFCVLLIFLVPKWRRSIIKSSRGFSEKITFLFISNKMVSAGAHIMLNYAIKLGSVAIVNALQAAGYAFVFILTLASSRFSPRICYESMAPKYLVPKMIGIGLVSAGVVLLFIAGA